MALRFEPLFVFGVVLLIAAWELVSMKRYDRRRRREREEQERAARVAREASTPKPADRGVYTDGCRSTTDDAVLAMPSSDTQPP